MPAIERAIATSNYVSSTCWYKPAKYVSRTPFALLVHNLRRAALYSLPKHFNALSDPVCLSKWQHIGCASPQLSLAATSLAAGEVVSSHLAQGSSGLQGQEAWMKNGQ
jgi:hypothetical protein